MAYATVEELAQALRVPVTASNTGTLQACLDAAAIEIDHAIDWPQAVQAAAAWDLLAAAAVSDPGDGNARLDSDPPQTATALAISTLDAEGESHPLDLLAAGDYLRLEEPDAERAQVWRITADPVSSPGWVALELAPAATPGSPPKPDPGERVRLLFARPAGPNGDPLANRVNVLRGVEWFKANDAAFGVIGFDQTGALQAPRDGFNRHAYALAPLKRQWGIA